MRTGVEIAQISPGMLVHVLLNQISAGVANAKLGWEQNSRIADIH